MAEVFVTNLNDSGEGSLRQAILGAVPQTTIKFSPELLGGLIGLETPLSIIANDLVIDGEGKIGLIANKRCRLVEIKSELKCTLKGLSIERGYSDSDGGGIYVNPKSNLILDSVKLSHNISKFVGGAIFVAYDSTLTIQDCVFEANEALSSQCNLTKGMGRGGGAIATLSRTNVTIKNSNFFNNRGTNGGAVNILLASLIVEDCVFEQNRSVLEGGAIFVDGASDKKNPDAGLISLKGSIFNGNLAVGEGGAGFIFVYPPDSIWIENCTFTRNLILANAKGVSIGGSLRIGNATQFTCKDSSFFFNQSSKQAAALFIDDKTVKAEVFNCTFAYNCAIPIPPLNTFSLGGALSTASPTSLTNCSFVGNFATSNGGAIFSGLNQDAPRPVTLTNCLFFNNTVASGTQQPVNRSFLDGGGNIQFPDSKIKITPNVKVVDPQVNIPQIEGIRYIVPLLPNSPCLNTGVSTSGNSAS